MPDHDPRHQAGDVGLLRSLGRATRLATASLDPDLILTASAQAIVRCFDQPRADAWRLDGGELVHVATAGAPDVAAATGEAPEPPLAATALVAASVARDLDDEALDEAGDHAWRRIVFALGASGMAAYPLLAGERVIGSITVVRGPRDPMLEDALAMFAEQVGGALEKALLHREAQRASGRLAEAHRLTRSLASATSTQELHGRLLDGIVELLGCTRVAAYDSQLLLLDWRGIGSRLTEHGLVESALRSARMRVRRSQGVVRWAAPLAGREGMRSILYGELPADGLAAGDDPFGDDERMLLQGIVDHATGSLALIATSDQLERNYMSTIQALTSALEARDQYTYDHASEVATWAVDVGRRFGLGESDLRDLQLGAMFHDIGKIAIPNEILNKPGKLTDTEWEIMKSHTIIGERIIAPIEFLRNVRPMVRHEHERWDGRGYPDGISGTDIPLGSRIIFVCDAYHAIVSDRPYRKARSHEVARDILLENAGTQFDPAVVSVFLDVIDLWRAEHEGAARTTGDVPPVELVRSQAADEASAIGTPGATIARGGGDVPDLGAQMHGRAAA